MRLTNRDVVNLLEVNNIQLVAKSKSKLMRVLGFLVFWNDDFMKTFWTVITLGPLRIIAFPTQYSYGEALGQVYTILHELTHVHQAGKPVLGSTILANAWYYIRYGLLPFPIFFAYFRMKFETEAYVVGFKAQIVGEEWVVSRDHLDSWVDWVADTLWNKYLLTWPPSWTRKRLKTLLAEEYASVGRVIQ